MDTDSLKCVRCGASVLHTDRFCARCGAPLVTPARSICHQCGITLGPADKFCIRCGAKSSGSATDVGEGVSKRNEEVKQEVKCSNCKHRQARNVCGSSQSPFYRNTIKRGEDRCDFFLLNPAEIHETKGMVYALEGGRHEEAIAEYEEAINLGLPHDDEMLTRFFLGEDYLNLVLARGGSWQEYVGSAQFAQAINHMEKALQMDREGGYGYFLDPLNRARLRRLDLMYNLAVDAIQERQNRAAAITYLQQKVGLCSYLPSCPLLHVLVKLGRLYVLEKQRESAKICLKNLLATEPVDRVDESGEEAKVREEAREGLRSIQ